MKTKWQFQNLALQKALQEQTQPATVMLPAITLPLRQKSPTSPSPLITSPVEEVIMTDLLVDGGGIEADPLLALEAFIPASTDDMRKKRLLRGVALTLCLLLALALYFAWHAFTSTSAGPAITQQNLSNASSSLSPNNPTAGSSTTSGTIQVYILGAVVHPGIYTLAADARVYQLLQAAGGPLPNANLVALNLAAKLTDGQEIYVLKVGEVPPDNLSSSNPGSTSLGTTTPGQLVNINTAPATEMQQALHVSAATAQKIINYRIQHGPYTAVNQLLQAVSLSIYNRIKNMVTV